MNQVHLYGKGHANLLGGESSGDSLGTDFLSDTIKMALLDSGHTPALDTHEVFDDVDGDEISGTGYTAGGATLGSKTITYTAANAWGNAWAPDTPYVVGDIVRPSVGNGHVYQCIIAGTSDSSSFEPSWPTVSWNTVVDNTVTWAEVGRGVTAIDAADPSWGSGATLSDIAFGVVYKSTGTPSTSPLMALVTFSDGPYSISNGSFTAQLNPYGLYTFYTP